MYLCWCFVKSWLLFPNAPKVDHPKAVLVRKRILPGIWENLINPQKNTSRK
ncbi:hypothetical protein B4167_0177 [Caldibacillus thermoamylovorans]|uniref:Uncharacterized protein n=1 Tax=Caldibacillus thermoamylovorans TaxID=35841 RepID=A0ABD4A2Y8_9BACI|nr:hypothetical protein B4167_0177 [Caldibacillus thermoamylovorans]